MAGYIVMFDEKNKMAIGLVGVIWAVGPNRFDELHDLVEKRTATKVPGNGQIIKYDDPDWQSFVDWLRENAAMIVTENSMVNKHRVFHKHPWDLIEHLCKNIVGVVNNG